MSWTKVILVNFLVFIAFISIILFAFELYLRANPVKYHSYGWIKNNSIKKITRNCIKKNGEVGVFGDSFVEYYRDTSNNLANILSAKLDNVKVCNFGLSGTGLDTYLSRYKYALKKTNIKKAIFYVYEGNDFFEVPKLEELKYAPYYDRKNNLLYSTLKQSFSLNFIWREAIKPLWTKEVKFKDYDFNYCPKQSDEKIQIKLNNLREQQPDIYKKFQNYQLNVSWLQVALNCPAYFDILSKDHTYQIYNLNRIKTYVRKLYEISTLNNVELLIIIIPHDYFVDNLNKKDWENIFQFDNTPYLGPTQFSLKLIEEFSFIHYANNLSGEDFLKFDGHLSPSGNHKLVNFTKKYFN